MISEKTKKYYCHMLNKAHALKIYSFFIKNDRVYIDESSLTVKYITGISLLANVGTILYFMFLGLVLSSNMQVTILTITVASTLVLSIGCQTWHFVFMNETPQLVSQFFKLVNHLHDTHDVPIRKSGDGIENVMQLVNFGTTAIEIGLLPVILVSIFFTDIEIVRLSWMSFYVMMDGLGITETFLKQACSTVGLVSLCFISCLNSIIGWYNSLLFVNIAILYTNSVRNWMKYYTGKFLEKSANNDQSKHRFSYLAHQVLHTSINAYFSIATELAIYCCMAVIVLCLYVLLTFPSQLLVQYILCCIGGIATYCLRTALVLSISCHINSKECCYVGATSISGNKMYNKKFWKSRRPISIQVGHEFKLETRNYLLRVYGEIIPENLINLLLLS